MTILYHLPPEGESPVFKRSGQTFYHDVDRETVFTLLGDCVYGTHTNGDGTFSPAMMAHYEPRMIGPAAGDDGPVWTHALDAQTRDIIRGITMPRPVTKKPEPPPDDAAKCPHCGNTDKDRMLAPDGDDVACCHDCGAAFDVERPEKLEVLLARVVAVVGHTPQINLQQVHDLLFLSSDDAPDQDAVFALIRLLVKPF